MLYLAGKTTDNPRPAVVPSPPVVPLPATLWTRSILQNTKCKTYLNSQEWMTSRQNSSDPKPDNVFCVCNCQLFCSPSFCWFYGGWGRALPDPSPAYLQNWELLWLKWQLEAVLQLLINELSLGCLKKKSHVVFCTRQQCLRTWSRAAARQERAVGTRSSHNPLHLAASLFLPLCCLRT